MKNHKVLIISNSPSGLISFRKSLIIELVYQGYQVYISTPSGKGVDDIMDIDKIKFIETEIDRRGLNPLTEFKLLLRYKNLVREINPDVLLTYTIKPNIYIPLLNFDIPLISNVTGLGSSLDIPIFGAFMKKIYSFSLKKSNLIFFQNKSNLFKMFPNGKSRPNHRLIPGSGVELEDFKFTPMDSNDSILTFTFVGRLMKDKGIYELINAFDKLNKKYEKIRLIMVGGAETIDINELQLSNNIEMVGEVNNPRYYYKISDCLIHPSYHEGMSNVMLEAAATGRPLLASNIPGCKEIIDDGVNGFLFEPRSSDAIVEAVEKFMALSFEERQQMGRKSREKVEREFDRQIVVDAYMEEIEKILGDN